MIINIRLTICSSNTWRWKWKTENFKFGISIQSQTVQSALQFFLYSLFSYNWLDPLQWEDPVLLFCHGGPCKFTLVFNTKYATLWSGIPWNIPGVTCIFAVYTWAFRRLCIRRNTSDKWDIPWFTTRKCCITILYHAI